MSKARKAQGIECPIIREGDNLVDIVVESVLEETKFLNGAKIPVKSPNTPDGIEYKEIWNIHNNDIIAITESVVARAAGQYITVDDIANDVEKKFGKDATIYVIHPIYSRNRFAMILKGIARAAKKVIITMPKVDEVGNPRGVNKFTGVNIEEYYKEICENENCECIIDHTECKHPAQLVCMETEKRIYCMLHDYNWCRKPEYLAYSLADICSDKSPDWGVLGTNKATDERLKLFPSRAECQRVCNGVKKKIKEKTGNNVIVTVYGDGCFHSPYLYDESGNIIEGTSINEFADPVSFITDNEDYKILNSCPNEMKVKYLADNKYKDLSGDELTNAIKLEVESIGADLKGAMVQEGCTPRRIGDLVASLCDLMSGSGSRCTPIVLLQNYI